MQPTQQHIAKVREILADTTYVYPAITAIKYYREITGTSLKDAKEAVENIRDNRPATPPATTEVWYEIEYQNNAGEWRYFTWHPRYETEGNSTSAHSDTVEGIGRLLAIFRRELGEPYFCRAVRKTLTTEVLP